MDLTRGLPLAFRDALASGIFHPVMFVHLDWPGDPVFAHSGVGDIAWGGQTWKGVGPVGSIGVPEESSGSMATSEATVTLAAGPEDVDAFVDACIRNRPGRIALGLVSARPGDPGGTDLLSDPVPVFFGMMDAAGLTFEEIDGGIQSSITVTLATGPGARSGATIYHSDQDQARRHPGDTAGRLAALARANAEKLTWPES